MHINGDISEYFKLFRGTWQGCPLSPLLFALALELLAIHVRASQDIIGFRRGINHDVISLYADDTLIYLGDTIISLKNVMHLIADFGALSGLVLTGINRYLCLLTLYHDLYLIVQKMSIRLINTVIYGIIPLFRHTNNPRPKLIYHTKLGTATS